MEAEVAPLTHQLSTNSRLIWRTRGAVEVVARVQSGREWWMEAVVAPLMDELSTNSRMWEAVEVAARV